MHFQKLFVGVWLEIHLYLFSDWWIEHLINPWHSRNKQGPRCWTELTEGINMEKGTSSWTKRRRIRQHLQRHLRNINANAGASSASEKSGEVLAFVANKFNNQEDMGSSFDEDSSDESPIEFESDSENEIFEIEIDSSEDESEQESLDDADLAEFLGCWAAQQKITLTAVRLLLDGLRKFHPKLPKDPRTLLKTDYNEIADITPIAGGSYYHFGIHKGICELLDVHGGFPGRENISLLINVDGLPLFKSSRGEFWPILGMVQDVDFSEPFVIGLFYGTRKPNSVDEYFQDFIQEMSEIQADGLSHNGRVYHISVGGFICHKPARSFVKCVKGHSGTYGCDKCTQSGVHIDGRMTFPVIRAPLRTDVAFDEMVDDVHHHKRSPLCQLGVGMVTAFPLDYMHLVCLGVMKKLFALWFKGPLKCRIGRRAKTLISSNLLSYQPFVPKEFVRKPRDLDEVDRWKATEFCQFLLYLGPVALTGLIDPAMYNNFMLFSAAIYILASPLLCHEKQDDAQNYLELFVGHCSDLYEPTSIVYNVHALVHVVQDVKVFLVASISFQLFLLKVSLECWKS